MYVFQIRRLVRHVNGKVRLKPVWTAWRTIDKFHKQPDLDHLELLFPSQMVEFRIQRAGKTIWRSDHRQDHKYDYISDYNDHDHQRPMFPMKPVEEAS